MRRARWTFVIALAIGVAGCSDECSRGPNGFCLAECFDSRDCPNSCDLGNACCIQSHRCEAGLCQPTGQVADECSITPVFPPPGWDTKFGDGTVFVLNELAVEQVFAANRLGVMSDRWSSILRQLLLGGDNLWGIQVAGANGALERASGSVTVSMAPLRDADDPYFPANNFRRPPGEPTCCEFLVRRKFLDENSVALARWPAVINAGRLESVGQTTFEAEMLSFALEQEDVTLKPFIIEQSRLQMDSVSSREFSGRVSGVHPAAWLATVSLLSIVRDRPEEDRLLTRLEEVFAFVGQPDVDIDGDGLECFYDLDGDFKIDQCCDGDGDLTCGAICTGETLPHAGPSAVACAGAAGAADGYSVSYFINGVRATIVGSTDL